MLEVVGLADVLVFVASDERYNDEVPTQFLRLLLFTGKPVVCCLTKMREQDAEALIEHFKKEVLRALPAGVVGCVGLPFLTSEQLADPVARLYAEFPQDQVEAYLACLLAMDPDAWAGLVEIIRKRAG